MHISNSHFLDFRNLGGTRKSSLNATDTKTMSIEDGDDNEDDDDGDRHTVTHNDDDEVDDDEVVMMTEMMTTRYKVRFKQNKKL